MDPVNARPVKDHKKRTDTGIDGYINFFNDKNGQVKQVIGQVKSGCIGVNHVRDLKGGLDREKAAIGVLITLREPTQPMLTEAAATGFHESKVLTEIIAPRPRTRKNDVPAWISDSCVAVCQGSWRRNCECD